MPTRPPQLDHTSAAAFSGTLRSLILICRTKCPSPSPMSSRPQMCHSCGRVRVRGVCRSGLMPAQRELLAPPNPMLTSIRPRASEPTGPSTSRQVAPTSPPLGQAPQGSGRPQPGGANTTAPAKKPKKTGASYSLSECMKLWDAKTHMTQGQWRAACARVQNHALNNLEVAEVG